MTNVITQTNCVNCSSSDAYTVYEDGHCYCFSCGYYQPSERSIKYLRKRLETISSQGRKTGDYHVLLPEDCTSYIPQEPLAWIKKYGITNEEIRENKICWSHDRQMLIFPFFNSDGECIFWQGRYFPKRVPKVHSEGMSKNAIAIIGKVNETNSVVFVEDVVSAIKVSRISPSVPLFGSVLHSSVSYYCSSRFDRAYLWLDRDKAKEAIKYGDRFGYLFKSGIGVIITDQDPKECSMETIKEKLC